MTVEKETSLDDNIYSQHLSEVNKTNKVISQEDIRNDKGAIIVPKGKQITPEISARLATHKLAKTLDQVVGIENVVTGKTVFEDLLKIPTHQDVKKAISSALSKEKFARELLVLDDFPVIEQRLTVLKSRYFEIYTKTILGCHFSWLMCIERNLNPDTRKSVILSAISRDLGLLYINPEVVNKKGKLEPEEWKLLQGHVLVSYHISKMIPGIPKPAVRAILEHHERVDGFGYPRGLTEDKLGVESQILAFSDMFLAIFYKFALNNANAVLALVPVLQVNASIHGLENGEAALRIIKHFGSEFKPNHSNETIGPYIKKLKSARPLFNSLVEQLNETHALLKENTAENIYRPSEISLRTLNNLIISSGISHESISSWIEDLNAGDLKDDSLIEVERYGMMLSEGTWRFNELLRYYREVVPRLPTDSGPLTILPNFVEQAEESFSKLTVLFKE
ncbi:MAG: hypothetical protein HWE27_16850 [Gammaproteobacteria bacterium]|nr:hypothetical protein [Gammaproteobacteria bacterium]